MTEGTAVTDRRAGLDLPDLRRAGRDLPYWAQSSGRSRPALQLQRCLRTGAALYLTTISIAVLLAGTGLTLIAIQREDRRLQDNIARLDELRRCARSGLEMAMAYMEQVPNWRQRATGNSLFTGVPVGNCTVDVQVFDVKDGNIANNDADPVRMDVIAKRDGATCKLEAQLVPRPHPALNYVLFNSSSADLQFKSAAVCRGPVRAHGNITAYFYNTVEDDASFETLQGYTIQNPLTPKSYVSASITAPQPDLNFYKTLATPVAGSYGSTCSLKGYNLTPTSNPVGTPNSSGIYSLDAGGRAVYIENLHVKGTLIIYNTGGNKVEFAKGLWIEPGPLQYPVLLIDCPLNIVDIHPDQAYLTEVGSTLVVPRYGLNSTVSFNVDFNEDGDVLDSFDTQIRGLVWATGNHLYLRYATWHFIGCCIHPMITVDNSVTVDDDLTLLEVPCPGFVQSGMKVLAGSIREVGP